MSERTNCGRCGGDRFLTSWEDKVRCPECGNADPDDVPAPPPPRCTCPPTNASFPVADCPVHSAPAAPAPRAEEPSVIEQAAARVLGHCKLARFAGAKGMNLNPDGDGAQVLAYIGDLELVAEAVKSLTADLARANEERAAGDDAQRGITEAARILSSAGIEDPDGSITGMATNAAALIERLRAEAEAAREQCANLVCKDCEGDVIRIGAWHYHTDEQATEHRGGWPCPAWPIHALNRLSPSPTPTEAS